jgi:hypothetical protein
VFQYEQQNAEVEQEGINKKQDAIETCSIPSGILGTDSLQPQIRSIDMEPFSLDSPGETAKLGLNLAFMIWVRAPALRGRAETSIGASGGFIGAGADLPLGGFEKDVRAVDDMRV